MNKALNRDEFREAVFKRDGYKCIFCDKKENLDAHHIIERRLFQDDSYGYYIDNGATVCEEHHIQCEMTTISCEEIRKKCNISKIILPPHLYDEYSYDKWGNIILNDSRRVKGELFYDESVQKILKAGGVLDQFIPYIKYPRSIHLPWSGCVGKDDRRLDTIKHFIGKQVVVTTKMDGENTSGYWDGYLHARSIDSGHHDSRSWAKNFWNSKFFELPEGWRICFENLYAEHAIHYDDLESYVMMFSIWNERNVCLSWSETEEWAELLDFKTVPVLYKGIFDEKIIKTLYDPSNEKQEGYVVRLADSFTYGAFNNSLAKYVRPNHIRNAKHHWASQAVIPNGLKNG